MRAISEKGRARMATKSLPLGDGVGGLDPADATEGYATQRRHETENWQRKDRTAERAKQLAKERARAAAAKVCTCYRCEFGPLRGQVIADRCKKHGGKPKAQNAIAGAYIQQFGPSFWQNRPIL